MAFKDQWTEEEDDFLRRAAEQGQSALAAAALLGDIFGVVRSRSAVLGRASRKGIVFKGQVEAVARMKADAEQRREARKTAPKPKPAARPLAEPVVPQPELRRPAGLLISEEPLAAPEPVATDANAGILFRDRKDLQCAWPLPGWDDLPVAERRVCGRPVAFRPGAYGAEPTSWCRACYRLVYQPPRRKLDAKALSRIDRTVVRRA